MGGSAAWWSNGCFISLYVTPPLWPGEVDSSKVEDQVWWGGMRNSMEGEGLWRWLAETGSRTSRTKISNGQVFFRRRDEDEVLGDGELLRRGMGWPVWGDMKGSRWGRRRVMVRGKIVKRMVVRWRRILKCI